MTSEAWTAGWVAEKIAEEAAVVSCDQLGSGLLRVHRERDESVVVATISRGHLDSDDLAEVLASDPKPDFVVNLARDSTLSARAFRLIIDRGVPVGRLGDLKRALNLANVREYREPEFAFVERGFTQHSCVVAFERLDERRYRVERRAASTVIVLCLNEYDVTADSVRTARELFGPFSLVALTNPNARVTEAAREVADELGAPLHRWGDLLKALRNDA